MESEPNNPPLVVVLGETASGKSALAMRLAQMCRGEIICADSRTVYRGMDIGTAKPSAQDRASVSHHMLDIVEPNEQFTVAEFKVQAQAAIDQIAARGHVPFLVGGTGLYIVLYDFAFGAEPDLSERAKLQQLSVQELRDLLQARKLDVPENFQNPRHLVHALELNGVRPAKHDLRSNTLVLGLRIPREKLEANVIARVDAMVAAGFAAEVAQLATKYGWDAPGLQAPGYKAFHTYIDGSATLEEAKAQFVRNDLALAKRQRTWFKRNKSIHWLENQAESAEILTTFLNKL